MFRSASIVVDRDRLGLGDHVAARPARRATPRRSVPSAQATRGPVGRRGAGRGRRRWITSGRSETIARPSSAHHGPAERASSSRASIADLAPLALVGCRHSGSPKTSRIAGRAAAFRRRTGRAASPGRRHARLANAASVSAARPLDGARRTAHGRDRSRSCRRSPSSRRRGAGRRGRRGAASSRSPPRRSAPPWRRRPAAARCRAAEFASPQAGGPDRIGGRAGRPSLPSLASSRCSSRRRQQARGRTARQARASRGRAPLPTSPRV